MKKKVLAVLLVLTSFVGGSSFLIRIVSDPSLSENLVLFCILCVIVCESVVVNVALRLYLEGRS